MNDLPKFFVLALPRSRTKWLATLLGAGHDLLLGCGSSREYAEAMEEWPGSVETAGVLGWRAIRAKWTDAKFVTVHRAATDVWRSFAAKGFEVDFGELQLREQLLLAAAQAEGVENFDYAGLAHFEVCAELYRACKGVDLDYDHWLALDRQNIQIDLDVRAKEIVKFAERAKALKRELVKERASRWSN